MNCDIVFLKAYKKYYRKARILVRFYLLYLMIGNYMMSIVTTSINKFVSVKRLITQYLITLILSEESQLGLNYKHAKDI